MVFLLSNTQMANDHGTNPFFFSPRGLKEACLIVDGQSLPSEKITLDKDNGDFRKIYGHFMDNIGLGTDCENGINPDKYTTRSFALAFDLTPDLCLNNHLYETNRTAVVDIRLVFSAPLTVPLTIMYMATYDDTVTIFPDKSVQAGVAGNAS